ncbi:MAG: EAL domain-containing protein [Methylovulum sp.]|nr:EAL domain-containing protein [Methylovulum sp.]
MKKPSAATKGEATLPSGQKTMPPGEPRYIVGIGASAGGLEAVTLLVSHLNPQIPCAYVLLQHLPPHHRSLMVEILAHETSVKVKEAVDGEIPKVGVIIVVPASFNATLSEGRLRLVTAGPEEVPKPSINKFFISLAAEEGDAAVGVVLSGTGSDGTAGLRAIQSAGGFTFVQKPETAKFDGMPRTAIDAGVVDRILSPEGIATDLAKLGQLKNGSLLNDGQSRNLVKVLLNRLQEHTLIDFSGYKASTLMRRIQRRLMATNVVDITAYLKHLDNHPDELARLSKDILISVTAFFRDRDAFNVLGQAIRNVCSRKTPGTEIRVWVAGCATGEEAYSIAMMFADTLGECLSQFKIQIFATDIDEDALSFARRGVYPAAAMSEVSPEQLQRYFHPRNQAYEASKPLRDLIMFARNNLASDPPFMRLDLVSCRNVLIYFEAALQARVLHSFQFGLNPDAYLFLGRSESITHAEKIFRPVDRRERLFCRSNAPVSANVMLLPHVEPTNHPTASSVSRRERRLLGDMLQGLTKHYGAFAVMVDENQMIVHSAGDAARFLSFPTGAPKLSLVDVVLEPLRGELLALLHRGIRRREVMTGRVRKLGSTRLRISVSPIEKNTDNYFLVLFDPVVATVKSTESSEVAAGEASMNMLEDELVSTHKHLQILIEEMATSHEEMQVLNEEAQAGYEELQATNEEMEAANEELQASNEELISVNEELNIRTAELAKFTAEYEHLYNTLEFPVLVFDTQMTLRRFNSAAVRLYGLRPSAIGQPLHRLKLPKQLNPLEDMIGSALAHSDRETALIHNEGHDYQIIITPGQDPSGETISLIASVIDVTELSRTRQALEEARQMQTMLMERTTVMYVMKDVRGQYLYTNPRFCEFFSLTAHEIIGKSDFAVFPNTIATDLWASDLQALREGKPITTQHMIQTGDNKRHLEAIHFPMMDKDGNISAVSMEATDITFRKHAEEQLRLAARVFDRAGDAILVTDAGGLISTVNPVFISITGYSLEEAVGHTPGELLKSGKQSKAFYEDMWRSLKADGNWHGEIWNKRKNGEIYPEWLCINRLDDENGKTEHYIAVFSDLSDIKNAQNRADFLATHDPLTNLPNRNLFQDRLRQSIASARREKTVTALLFIDLDEFKMVNDSLGHDAGDVLLKIVSERLLTCVRDVDTIARLGGDEFTAILDDCPPAEAEHIARRMLDELSRSFEVVGQRVFISCSIGVAFYPEDGDDSASLLQAADTAMYRAKAGGRNRFEFFRPDMRVAIMERATLETALRIAIQQKRLTLVYQPRILLADHSLAGAEALARWTDPNIGAIGPDRFIPIAEQSGLIVDLSRLLLDQLLDQIVEWQGFGIKLPPIAFNLSSRDFRVADTAAFILSALQVRGLPVSVLQIEITERVMVDDQKIVNDNMQALHAAGIELAIDDFGTGFSSLAYLKRMPITALKIDRSFVDGLPQNEDDASISLAVIGLAQAMNLVTVAEGVETEHQLAWLVEHGCDEAQGYYFYKPLDVVAFEGLLTRK